MSEFTIHHHAAELLRLFDIKEGDGPEVYVELLTKDLTPYVTNHVSTISAKKKIADANSANAQEFYRKYDELKGKNVRELDSLVYLLSALNSEQFIVKFIEKNAKLRSKRHDDTSSRFSDTASVRSADDAGKTSSPMTSKDVQDLKTKLATITVSQSQNSTDVLLKALREKHAKVSLAPGVPSVPAWVNERGYLTNDFVNVYRQNYIPPIEMGTLPLKLQEGRIIEDFLYLFVGIEGRYINIKEEADKKMYPTFSIDSTLDPSFLEVWIVDLLPNLEVGGLGRGFELL